MPAIMAIEVKRRVINFLCLMLVSPVSAFGFSSVQAWTWQGNRPMEFGIGTRGAFSSPCKVVKGVMMSLGGKDVIDSHARVARQRGFFELLGKDPAVESWLAQAEGSNPTKNPGDWSDLAKSRSLAEGVWEVCYAPHISTLQRVLAAKFSPIRYTLMAEGEERSMVSNVRFDSKIFGKGWLNTAGGWTSIDKDTVQVFWKRFWVDIGTEDPSPVPSGEDAGWVQALGSIAFLPVFSLFPVKYVDGDTCVFEFSATKTCIVARKVT